MNILKDKVIYISLDDWRVVYFKGQNFAEGHRIYDDYLIRLGMLMKEADIDISEIIRIEIDVNDVSDESLLWDWADDINELDDEIKELIIKNINK